MWSGISIATRRPSASVRCRTTRCPSAVTVDAGPTQRIIASYQIPSIMMLLPDRSRLWRQCGGESDAGKSLPMVTWASTATRSPM